MVRLLFPEEVSTGDLIQELVHLEEWEHLEGVLLKLSRGSGNAL